MPAAGYELRDEGLLRLVFADALSPDDALELVRTFRRIGWCSRLERRLEQTTAEQEVS